jgi:transposase
MTPEHNSNEGKIVPSEYARRRGIQIRKGHPSRYDNPAIARQAEEALRNGEPVRVVAKKARMSERATYNFVKRKGIPLDQRRSGKFPRNEEQKQEVDQLIAKGKSFNVIASKLGVSRKTIQDYAPPDAPQRRKKT